MIVYLQMIDLLEDQSKFEKIYYTYRGLMFHIAKSIVRQEQDAEDAVHEAFIKIARNINKISDPLSPKTRAYVVQIVENTAIDQLRKKRRHVDEVPLEDHLGVSLEYSGENRVVKEILSLPAYDREVLLLRYDMGYSVRETAQILGISYVATRKREQRAKRRLMEKCKEEELL